MWKICVNTEHSEESHLFISLPDRKRSFVQQRPQVAGELPVIIQHVQCGHLFPGCVGQQLRGAIFQDHCRFLREESGRGDRVFQAFPVFRASGLAHHAADQSVVPAGVDPFRKIRFTLVEQGQAAVGADQCPVCSDRAGGAFLQAGGAILAPFQQARLLPVVFPAGQVAVKCVQAEKAALARDVEDIVSPVHPQAAAGGQELHGQRGGSKAIAGGMQGFFQHPADLFRIRPVYVRGRDDSGYSPAAKVKAHFADGLGRGCNGAGASITFSWTRMEFPTFVECKRSLDT